MALYIPQSILHLARSLYVRPETYGPTYVCVRCSVRTTIVPWDILCFYGFPQPLQINSVLISQLGYYRSHTWQLQFVSHPKIQRWIAQGQGRRERVRAPIKNKIGPPS